MSWLLKTEKNLRLQFYRIHFIENCYACYVEGLLIWSKNFQASIGFDVKLFV
jgi:hypothetical protein